MPNFRCSSKSLKNFTSAVGDMMHSKHKGAHGELLACVWLLAQGYDVFRNISSHGYADIAAFKGTEFSFFDVKTWDPSVTRSPPWLTAAQKQAGVKLLAVKPDGACEIDPEHRVRTERLMRKNCVYCTEPFETTHPTKIYCSLSCRSFAHLPETVGE